MYTEETDGLFLKHMCMWCVKLSTGVYIKPEDNIVHSLKLFITHKTNAITSLWVKNLQMVAKKL